MAIFDIEFNAKSFSRSVPIKVILPVDNDLENERKKEPYKTIYMLHGFYGNQNNWIYHTDIVKLAEEYNIAVVMPSGENGFYLDDEVRNAFYGKYLGEELIDFTRTMFNLSHKKEDTIIAGLSMGGYGAMRNGLKYHDVFGTVFAFSSAFVIDRLASIKPTDTNEILTYNFCVHTFGKPENVLNSDVNYKLLAKELVDKGVDLPKLYMACGTEDYLLEGNREFDEYLTEIGYPHVYLESAGEHEWYFWAEYIKKALKWYFDTIW